jgi:bifunctional NMN adenylyltransferase/nudix hydrolase
MANKSGTGVLMARLQVPDLSEAQRLCIENLCDQHERVLIFLGSNIATNNLNPLDFEFRRYMLVESFGDRIDILEMPDLPDDRIWSQELDRRILLATPGEQVMLYGSEIGVIAAYHGRYPTKVLEIPASDYEEAIDEVSFDANFRAGIIYANLRRFPTMYPTVDLAVLRNNREVLLGRKENETKLRFPGGFCDPADDCFEVSALRELAEECGLTDIDDLEYLGSFKIDDWRYRGSVDAVCSHFYCCDYISGEPAAGDDLSEIKWMPISKLKDEHFVPEHRALWQRLRVFLEDFLA